MTPWEQAFSRTIFLSITGSRLYGTAVPSSDVDVRGIWVGRPLELLGAHQYDPNQVDCKVTNLPDFMKLLVTGDNNSIEMLHGLEVFRRPEAAELLKHRWHFLSNAWIRSIVAFGRKLNHANHPKQLAHGLRVLAGACYYLKTGIFQPNLKLQGWTDNQIQAWIALKSGKVTDLEPVREAAAEMVQLLEPTRLHEPNMALVNSITQDIQISMWRQENFG